jgi:hypothetical protein
MEEALEVELIMDVRGVLERGRWPLLPCEVVGF